MASEEQRDLKKDLLKKDKLELVKILKKQKQPTNGSKADMVDRILAKDQKSGGKMARSASRAAQKTEASDDDEYEYGDDDDDDGDQYDEDEEEQTSPPRTPPSKKKKKKKKKSQENKAPSVDCNCSPNLDCGRGFVGIAQAATCMAAIGQLILGLLQFILLMDALSEVCDTSVNANVECIGSSLFWDNGSDETDSFNVSWRAGTY